MQSNLTLSEKSKKGLLEGEKTELRIEEYLSTRQREEGPVHASVLRQEEQDK